MKSRLLCLFTIGSTAVATFLLMPAANASQQLPTISVQLNNSFAFFRTHRQGKGATATWGMAANEGIVDFTIQRTYEDPTDPYAYWEDLAVVSNNAGRSFSYTDKNVYPGIIHYRIVALRQDGSTETSDLSTIRIVSRH